MRFHQGSHADVREHCLAVRHILVVRAFHVELEEAVEQDLGGLEAEFLAPSVRSDLHRGVQHPGICHLGSDSPLPDEGVELLLLRGSFNLRVGDEGRADCLMGFLSALAVGFELPCRRIFRAEVGGDIFTRGGYR